jgi:hypothetical protein
MLNIHSKTPAPKPGVRSADERDVFISIFYIILKFLNNYFIQIRL